MLVSGSSGCPKCGFTKRSGKYSCCARGGAWFKNCGSAGDIEFDHTWDEGIQACKGFVASVSVKSPLQVIVRGLDTIQLRNTTQQANTSRAGSVFNVGTTDCNACVGITKIVICVCVLLVIPHL